jgi:tail protein
VLLKALSATNSRGQLLSIPLEDEGIGFYIRDIKGLDPVKATLVSSSFANMDGSQYQSSRREARNIVITLGLDPDYGVKGVEELRKQLYAYFLPKLQIDMTYTMFDKFATDVLEQTLDLHITGVIESFDAPLFTDDPQATISVMCFDPDFVDQNTVTFDGMSVSDLTETTVTYDGSIDTGVYFRIMPDRELDAFTVYHRPPDQTLRTVDVQLPLIAGDILIISSVRGDKYANLISGGVQSSVLYGITPQSAWIELQEGDNSFRVYSDGDPVPFRIEYFNKYGGL